LTVGIFYCLVCSGQIRFNKRYNLDFAESGYGIKKIQNGYLIIGPAVGIDSIYLVRKLQTILIDSVGNITNHLSFSNWPNRYYAGWTGSLTTSIDSSFLMAGSYVDTALDSDFLLYK